MQKVLLGLLLLFCIASAGYTDHDYEEPDKYHEKHDKFDKDEKCEEEEEEPLLCYKTGKYGEICAESAYETEGPKKKSYKCFEKAKCEPQFPRRCGFTITPEFVICLIKVYDD